MPEVAFVTGERQNPLWRDLVAAVRHELELQGVRTLMSSDGYPDAGAGRVLVIVGPAGYPDLPEGEAGEKLLRRAIWLCADPGAAASQKTLAAFRTSAAVFDLHRSSAADLRRGGIGAQHFQLGHTAYWDPDAGSPERDIDLLVCGFADNRGTARTADLADALERRRAHILMVDGAVDHGDPSGVAAPMHRLNLLSRARVVIQVHGDARRHFDWLAAVPALIRGCAVVSEHGLDHHPLQPGEHFISGRAKTLGALADALLADEGRRREMCESAATLLRERLPLRDAVTKLAAVAAQVDRQARTAPSGGVAVSLRRPHATDEAPDGADMEGHMTRRALKNMRLQLRNIERELARERLGAERGSPPPRVELDRASTAYRTRRPRVSVITALYDKAEFIEEALDSVATSRYADLEAIVVDDGSSDDSPGLARAWIEAHDDTPALLLRHPVNAGLSRTRNTALAFARGELTMVLDADNELLPSGLGRLVEALDEDLAADFAYGVLQRHAGDEAIGLLSMFPWEPERLRTANYIDAMALLRTRAVRELGGYTTDPRFDSGWEDYDLWCRMAEHGRHGAFVPEFVGRYRAVAGSMVDTVNVSLIDVSQALVERHPSLMAGVDPLTLAGVSR